MIEEGFAGQKLVVVPDSLTSAVHADPAFASVVVTDCGYYPHATNHGMRRIRGIQSTVVLLCTGGAGTVTWREERYGVAAGDAVILESGSPHTYASSQTEPWTVWWFHARGLHFSQDDTNSTPVHALHNIAELTPFVRDMIHRLDPVPSVSGSLAASGAARHLWALLTVQIRYGHTENSLVRQVHEFLSTHFSEPFHVDTVARHLRMSAAHLMSTYKKRTGETLLGTLTDIRMSHARGLLLTEGYPIASVARESGFEDPYYFSRRFKQYHGASPAEFRKNPPG